MQYKIVLHAEMARGALGAPLALLAGVGQALGGATVRAWVPVAIARHTYVHTHTYIDTHTHRSWATVAIMSETWSSGESPPTQQMTPTD
jgi:hypothetical protein